MKKYKMTLQYLGTRYCGWQVQPDGPTIQSTLQDILSKTLGEKITVIGSGRTDSGVHALGQVAHFETSSEMELATLHRALNAQLPDDIAVYPMSEVTPDFHANKSALSKTYSYFILNSRHPHPFLTPYVWRQFGDWDTESLQKCLSMIGGRHDFKAFCAADSTAKTTEREILSAHLELLPLASMGKRLGAMMGLGDSFGGEGESGREVLALHFTGRGFLKHMIRNLVGTLRDVGRGSRSVEDFQDILRSLDRRQAGVTAPAKGLFLIRVDYP